jgi:glucokinase
MTSVLAVDLGGTKTAVAHVDATGTIANYEKSPASISVSATVSWIAERAVGVEAVGIIVPGIYNPVTGSAWAPNLWGWDEVPLRVELESSLSCPVVIESDRSGYVLGEQWLGAARGLRDVVFAAIGTGIGVGILAEGRVVRGAHGIAGAAGWTALDPRWKDAYARNGCWETEAAGPAVARRYGAASAQDVADAARRGDVRAQDVMEETAEYLAMGLANLVSLLNPEMLVLGGGLMQAADLLLAPIRRRMERWTQPVAFRKTQIELTRLGENAGLLGAARLAFLAQGASAKEGIYVG